MSNLISPNREASVVQSASDSDDTASSSKTPHGSANHVTKPVKRSCNHCRQQKLRCDVIQTPFQTCSRCRRLGKTCTVDKVFKRVGKRDKYVEMQREIADLRRQLDLAKNERAASEDRQVSKNVTDSAIPIASITRTNSRILGAIKITGQVLDELHNKYFTAYHPFLPFLDSQVSMDHYFELSPLLGWSIVIIAARHFPSQPNLFHSLLSDYSSLLWKTISEMPQTPPAPPYHVVKALCLVCAWPLPNKNHFQDQTYQLTGIMLQIALRNMLHLPVQVQIAPFEGRTESEQRDRLITWVACTIVAQSASTVYGLPPQTTYDWVLCSDFQYLAPYRLPEELLGQLRISKFCNTVSKVLYCDSRHSSGFIPDAERVSTLAKFVDSFANLRASFGHEPHYVIQLHLLVASTHLHAFALFIPLSAYSRDISIHGFYSATCQLFQKTIDLDTSLGTVLENCNNLISQTLITSSFALLRILSSSFASKIDAATGKVIFNAGLLAVKRMSIEEDDMPARCWVRIPEQWKAYGSGMRISTEPLVLKIGFRMSISHVYDSMWRWKLHLMNEKDGKMRQEAVANKPNSSVTGNNSQIFIPQPEFADSINDDLGINLDYFEIFNWMDWMMGDEIFATYDFNSQNNAF